MGAPGSPPATCQATVHVLPPWTKCAGAEPTAMVGTDSTVTPSAVEAAAAVVPRLEESVVSTAASVVEAGTAMVAVTMTL